MSTIASPRIAGAPSSSASAASIVVAPINPAKLVMQYRFTLIFSVIAGLIVGTIAYLLFQQFSPRYRATVTYQTLPPLADPLKGEAAFQDREEFERFASTQARILVSERLLRDTIVNDQQLPSTEWAKQYSKDGKIDPGLATEALRDITRARVITGTSLIEMSVTAPVPTDTKVIAEAVHRAFFRDLSGRGRVNSGEQMESLNNTLNTIRADIRRIDGLIAQRQAERNITGGTDNTDGMTLRVQSLQPQLLEVTARLERAKSRFSTLEAQLQPGAAVVYTDEQRENAEKDPVILGLKQRVGQLRAELGAKRQGGLGAEHKEVLALTQLLEQTEAELNGERERTLRKLFDSEYDQVRQARDSAEAELKELTRILNETSRRREDIAKALTEIELLKADREKMAQQQARLKEAIDELALIASIDRQDRVGRVRRIEEPRTPDRLYFPRLELMLPLGVIVVVGLTIGVIVLREIVDQRVKGPSDVSMIRGVRLLGIVPSADEDPSRPASVETAFRDSPTGAVSEGFRQVRGQLVKRLGQSGAKSLLVLSGAPGSGATSAVSNLAMGMAASDLKVLVIDANFRRPALHRVFKLAEGPGLGDVLMHKNTLDEAVQQTSVANLSLLAAGSGPSRAVPERLATETMSQIIKTAVARYDVVLVDTAPAMIAGEGLALANRCDAVCLVVRAFSEKRGLIARLRDQLADAKAEFLGVVVNGVRSASGGYLRKNIKTASDYQSGAAA